MCVSNAAIAADTGASLPIAADAKGANAGRTFQSSAAFSGPIPGVDAPSLRQVYNFTLPRESGQYPDTAFQFYSGAIGADGGVYYFGYGSGVYGPLLYKVVDGNLTWRVELPTPKWQSYTGNDPLLLSQNGILIAIPSVMSYNSPIQAYIAGLQQSTGAFAWMVNASTTVVQNARLSGDGATLYVHWLNASLSMLDVATGKVKKTYDISKTIVPNVTYYMTIAEGLQEMGDGDAEAVEDGDGPAAPGKAIAVFTTAGNVTAVNLANGKKAWAVADPTGSSFAPAYGVAHVAGSKSLFVATGDNYLQQSGYAALSTANGKLVFNKTWGTTFIGVARYATTQGYMFVYTTDSSSYNTIQWLSSANGTRLGQGYLPHPLYGGLSFTSAVTVSSDGKWGYFTAEGSSCDTCTDDVYLIGFNLVGGVTPLNTTYAVKINELCAPDYRQVAIGPQPGQLTVWWRSGFVVYEAGQPLPGPQRAKLCR